MYTAVDGPSVSVRPPGNPQVLSSMQRIAYVVADAFCALLGNDCEMGRSKYRSNNSTDERLSVCAWDKKRDCGSLRKREACKCKSKNRERGNAHIEWCCSLTMMKQQYREDNEDERLKAKKKKKKKIPEAVLLNEKGRCFASLLGLVPDPHVPIV